MKTRSNRNNALSAGHLLAALLKLLGNGNLVPFLDNVVLSRMSIQARRQALQLERLASMSECSSSHVDDASSTAKLDCGVIVETMCSRASAPRPGIAYRWAI